MKSKVLLVAVVFCLFHVEIARAQRFLVKSGLNISKVEVRKNNSNDSLNTINGDILNKTGFHVGVVMDIPFNNNWALQTGMSYSNKGFKQSYSDEFSYYDFYSGQNLTYKSSADLIVRTNYLEIPILIKGGIKIGNSRISALAGPYFSLALSGSYHAKSRSEDPYGYVEESEMFENLVIGEKSSLHPIDYGFMFGADFESGRFLLSANYSLGMQNILPSAESEEYMNRNLMVSVGYMIFEK